MQDMGVSKRRDPVQAGSQNSRWPGPEVPSLVASAEAEGQIVDGLRYGKYNTRHGCHSDARARPDLVIK